MDPAITTLCVLAVAAFLFITELIPLAVTAMAACTALGILGVLPSKQVYAGLSNSTVVLFGGMFVIGAAMFKTGLAEAIGVAVVKKAGTNEIPLMAAIMIVTMRTVLCFFEHRYSSLPDAGHHWYLPGSKDPCFQTADATGYRC